MGSTDTYKLPTEVHQPRCCTHFYHTNTPTFTRLGILYPLFINKLCEGNHGIDRHLQAPHRSPSASIVRTHFSSSAMSVSSSQGFTSRRRLLLAIRAGSENRLDQMKLEMSQWDQYPHGYFQMGSENRLDQIKSIFNSSRQLLNFFILCSMPVFYLFD